MKCVFCGQVSFHGDFDDVYSQLFVFPDRVDYFGLQFSMRVTSHPNLIQRLNYGVLFRKVSMLDTTAQQWTHTFIIPLASL